MNFHKITSKWQKKWDEAKIFEVKETKKKKFYMLEMFPYPSGAGLHIGHAFNYVIGDIHSRFKIMNGFNVLHPMGYDSLGLPAENAAIKEGTHPQDYTKKSIKNFIKQQKALGITYDWSRIINTSDPEYYKWDQWIFLKMFEKGLAYKKKSPVNWCPECNTVLANEQVESGKCWRHTNTDVEVKNLSQWFFKTTDYAEELNDFSKIEQWPELIKKLQKNWIGKSHGSEVIFEINGEKWPVFTTRPDTLFGVTFVVVSAQHNKLLDITTEEQKAQVEAFIKKQNSVSAEDIDQLEKEGVFTGSYAIHPLTKEKIPVFAGNFVLAEYGSGMVMAVPAHDQRDYDFAKKYKIEMKEVIQSKDGIKNKAFTGSGKLINSKNFDGKNNEEAKELITKELAKLKLGKKTTNYRLRDWLISRQRYWGTPIPIITCAKCGEVPVPEKELPVILPKNVKFGKGNPLETASSWINAKCPKCEKPAKRVTDTMDTFVNSSWYYLRYADPNNSEKIFDEKKANYWAPVDFYIGGKEHACMHLIYIRYYTKFLRDIGILSFDEPAVKLVNQGLVHGSDGNKMSKSLGNVVNPLDAIEKYSSDSLRMFLVSVASPESDFAWDDKGLASTHKFLQRVYTYFDKVKVGKSTDRSISKLNKSIKLITEDIEKIKYNLAIIKIRELFEKLNDEESKETLISFIKLLSPFCPHLAEELNEKLGNKEFISLEKWPVFEEKLINEQYEIIEELESQIKSDIFKVMELAKISKPKKITLIQAPKWKYEFFDLLNKQLNKTRNVKEIIPVIMQTELKKHSKDIMKLIPKFVSSGLPNYLSQKDEELALKEIIAKSEFNIELIKAEDSKEAKAIQAMPSKPAMIME